MILSHRLRAAAGNSGEQLPDIITTNLEQHIDFGFTSCYDQSSSYSTVSDLSGNGHDMVVYYNSNPLTSSNASKLVVDTGTTPSHVNLAGDDDLDLRQTYDVWNDLGTGDYTLEFWLNIKQVNFQNSQWIWVDTTATPAAWTISTRNEKMTVYSMFNNSNQVVDLDSSAYYSTDGSLAGWEHLVFSKIGTGSNDFKFYRNNSLTFTGTTNNPSYLKSGNGFTSNSSNRFWTLVNYAGYALHGKFAIHRFYRGKGLTQTEVTYNYNAQKARFGL